MSQVMPYPGEWSRHERISAKGWVGFCTSLTFILSTSVNYRLEFGPFLIHAYLLVLPVAVLITGFSVRSIDRRVLSYILAFSLLFSLACLFNPGDYSHLVKVLVAMLTFVFFAQLITSEQDFRLVAYGIIACGVLLGIRTIFISDDFGSSRVSTGVVALEGIGNKNAQSLYMLPGLFFSGWMLSEAITRNKKTIIFLHSLLLIVMVVGLVLTANRSGWVVAILILLFTLFRAGINYKLLLLLPVLYIPVSFYVENFALDIVDRKYKQTFVTTYASDNLREFIIVESMYAGLQKPLLGYGPRNLAEYLAEETRVLGFRGSLLDPHNLYGYLLGGAGVFTFLTFFLFLYSLANGNRHNRWANKFNTVKQVRLMLIFFIIVFLLRSFFTREILYSPTFIAAMAIIYAYYKLQVRKVVSGAI